MLPEIRLDTDRFFELLEEYRAMIAGIYPEWTDYNYHDPGMTFLELFVWLRENQQFHMEQLGADHYEQFFRLLGFQRKSRRPGRMLAKPERPERLSIPAGSRFAAGGLVFETEEQENLPGDTLIRAASFTAQGERTEEAGHHLLSRPGGMCFYPFGARPQVNSRCRFYLTEPLTPGTVYRLSCQTAGDGKRNPLSGGTFFALARIGWSCHTASGWRPLTILRDETHEFLFSGRISFLVEERMEALPEGTDGEGLYALEAVLLENSYDVAPVLSGAGMNQIVLAQKETWRKDEPFCIARGNGFPSQEYPLPWKEPIASSVRLEVEDALCPGRFVPWTRVEDFSGCGPSDLCYRVDEDTGCVCFGDGFYGMPPEGDICLLTMECTRGGGGNVKEGIPARWEADGVTRRFEMTAELERGTDRENLEEALFRLRSRPFPDRRAVTREDYERAVRQTPGLLIYSCRVLPESGGENEVAIVVRPGDETKPAPLSRAYRKNILKHLDAKRLIGTRIRLFAPEYIGIGVYLEISAMPQYREAKEMALAAVREWFGRLGASFGQPVSYGALYGMIDSLACVKRLRVLALEAGNAKVTRNPGGDLLPPPNGVFLLKHIDYLSVSD